jgi:hypothetical protein
MKRVAGRPTDRLSGPVGEEGGQGRPSCEEGAGDPDGAGGGRSWPFGEGPGEGPEFLT